MATTNNQNEIGVSFSQNKPPLPKDEIQELLDSIHQLTAKAKIAYHHTRDREHAWYTIWDTCKDLGMKPYSGGTGLATVINFIKELHDSRQDNPE